MVVMDFGEALEALKSQRRVAREGWNGMWLVMMPPQDLPSYNTQGTAKLIGEDAPLRINSYIVMFTADKNWQPCWLASQADMLAEDWIIID